MSLTSYTAPGDRGQPETRMFNRRPRRPRKILCQHCRGFVDSTHTRELCPHCRGPLRQKKIAEDPPLVADSMAIKCFTL